MEETSKSYLDLFYLELGWYFSLYKSWKVCCCILIPSFPTRLNFGFHQSRWNMHFSGIKIHACVYVIHSSSYLYSQPNWFSSFRVKEFQTYTDTNFRRYNISVICPSSPAVVSNRLNQSGFTTKIYNLKCQFGDQPAAFWIFNLEKY